MEFLVMSDYESVSGPQYVHLANAVSDLITTSIASGVRGDAVVSVVMTVAADHARLFFSDEYLPGLAELVLKRRGEPLPDVETLQ